MCFDVDSTSFERYKRQIDVESTLCAYWARCIFILPANLCFLVHVTEVEAGDRLKVGWVSNNHGGGYARIALVPWEERKNAQSYKNNVMKFACYGHDERPGNFQYGDCKHPCNGRPGCEYQSRKKNQINSNGGGCGALKTTMKRYKDNRDTLSYPC